MSRRASTTGARSSAKRGRRNTLLWIGGMTAIVIGLLYWEKIALLYVLATLGLTALMVIVAMADLGGSKKIAGGAVAVVPADDAAAIASGISSTPPSGAGSASSSKPRATMRK
jgi:hypothetical protein